MIIIDGSRGEGGGQILRSALSLSAITGQALRIEKIRAGRAKPGLMRQHLACVQAAARCCDGAVVGDFVGSTTVELHPNAVRAQVVEVEIDTAGSTALVVQTVLPIFLKAPGRSLLRVSGGTCNPLAPPIETLQASFLPLLRRMGVTAELRLVRHGFFPAGGGRVELEVVGGGELLPIDLGERGAVRKIEGVAVEASLSGRVGERELSVLQRLLAMKRQDARVEVVTSTSPGNALFVHVHTDQGVVTFDQIGEKGKRAEAVAEELGRRVLEWLDLGVAVDEHLQDQLLLPFALAGGGSMTTVPLSSHTRSNIEVIGRFLPIRFVEEPWGSGGARLVAG